MNKLGFVQPNFFKVTYSYPSSVISYIHNAPHGAEVSRIISPGSENRHPKSPVNESTTSRVLKDVHLPTQLLDGFLDLAKDNTSQDLETCGVLGAFLKEGTYYVTTLIIPKQDSTSNTVMVPEAVAIVMAPTDTSRSYGYFRLSDPYGIKIVRECQETGFHSHGEPADGTSIYEDCSNIYLNPNLRLEICDLRY